MQLKVLITVFQKMKWFIDVWATVHEIKISKKLLTQQKFNKIPENIKKDAESAEI